MSEVPSPGVSPGVRWVRRAISLPLLIAAFVAERLVSRRGLILGFFLAAAWLATAAWLRPPLSRDIHGLNLPLSAWPGGITSEQVLNPSVYGKDRDATKDRRVTADEILNGPHQILVDSIGALLLAIIVVGGATALLRPRCFGVAAGFLLSASLCANAAVVLNHPRLVYLLDLELEQRAQMARLYWFADNNSATNNFNDRISGQPASSLPAGLLTANSGPNWAPSLASVYDFLPAIEEERGGWERGLLYIRWGPYLVLLAFAGALIGLRGTLSRRVRNAALYTLLGTVLAGLACSERLRAEYYWQNAKILEGRCDYAGARTALEACCSASRAFQEREQTWLLAGKMDDVDARVTPARQFFRAFQAYRPKPRPGPMARLEDLPAWPTTMTRDSREWRLAVGISQGVLGGQEVPRQSVATQAARFWTQIGLMYYLQGPRVTDSGFQYPRRERVLTAALEAWRTATRLAPSNWDPLLYQGLALARTDRDQPLRVREVLQPLLDGLVDRPVRADIMATLADCYLEAGQYHEFLPFYKESADEYTLPKIVNHHAFKGLGGW